MKFFTFLFSQINTTSPSINNWANFVYLSPWIEHFLKRKNKSLLSGEDFSMDHVNKTCLFWQVAIPETRINELLRIIHWFRNKVLSISYVLGIVMGTRNIMVNKTRKRNTLLTIMELSFWLGWGLIEDIENNNINVLKILM